MSSKRLEKKPSNQAQDKLNEAGGSRLPSDPVEHFNMAYLAIRGSSSINDVSRLHGKVSRRIFKPLFPHWSVVEVPIDHVTNGVHMPSWDSESADGLWTQLCGKDRWLGTTEALECDVSRESDEKLWQFRILPDRVGVAVPLELNPSCGIVQPA